MGEAAELTGLSEQHFRRIIAEWVQNREAITAGVEGRGLPWRRGWLRAEMSGGRWWIEAGELAGYWRRRRPPAVRVAYDVVATVEKSVAVLTLLSADAVGSGCVAALLAANEAGMGWLEQRASVGRRQGETVGSEGFTWASFLHATSRSLDPHPHVHNLVMNFLEDPEGDGRAVDARFLFVEAKAASAIATSALRCELCHLFPALRWARHRLGGVWELAGISAEVIEEFSTRRSEIEAAARRLARADGRLPTRAELQEISASTRPAKQIVDAADVLADWWDRAERLGFDPLAVTGDPTSTSSGARFGPVLSEAERLALFEFLATSPEGVCAEESTFDFGDLLAAVNRWAPAGQPRPLPAEALLAVANEFLATGLAVPVDHDVCLIRRRDGRPAGTVLRQPRWTTPEMVRTQLHVRDAWQAGTGAGFLAGVPAGEIRAAGREAGLDREQVALIEAWSGSGDQFQAAIGRPGSGKTYTMRAARQVWEAHGWRVLGAAVKGTAAQHLGRATGIPSETVAHYLTAADAGHNPLDARTVLVVDEATTLSDQDLAEPSPASHATDLG